jgi:hypothetical protein
LTPIASQEEFFSGHSLSNDDRRDAFDNNHRQPLNEIEMPDRTNTFSDMDAELDSEISHQFVPARTIHEKRRIASDDASRPSKRRVETSGEISADDRDESVKLLTALLSPLQAPESFPDLLDCLAKRLEQQLFEGQAKDRSINALGRSSTLIMRNLKRQCPNKYNKDKEILMKNVTSYVEIASRDDVEIEQIQQGHIWDVIKQLLDERS